MSGLGRIWGSVEGGYCGVFRALERLEQERFWTVLNSLLQNVSYLEIGQVS